ncbi:DUF3955 domain-containing protein [Nitratireductor pacificus]|uniref:DUF3955 domain-containing protein n=1 Tax=Nitratireductor pacificus pht-3B TaxID=391937 RepID=K2MJP9_9HYPH|nr:DUF3955 domain-containing protein [Nitratireductor pacificus]EKF17407.1 hypothetical protein NA2_17881 [Nitratireductor pacificus pht-3B]
MKFFFFCGLCLLAVGVFCLIAAGWIGSSVDPDGMLHEPFALIAIGAISTVLGATCGALGLGIVAWRRIRAS